MTQCDLDLLVIRARRIRLSVNELQFHPHCLQRTLRSKITDEERAMLRIKDVRKDDDA